ncbi:hypothetical protein [Neobacillus sp. Marseille-QA0830]
MNTSKTIVDEKYEEAIQSLKKINDLLFYDELKKLLEQREQTMSELNEEVYESVEKMQKSLNNVPLNISEQLKEAVITPQSELFDSGMRQLNDKILLLDEKIALWDQRYQEYVTMTEQLLEDLKDRQRNDYQFIEMQTEKVLEVIRSSQEQVHVLVAREINEQASILNVKYDSISERLSFIHNHLTSVEANFVAEAEQWKLLYQQDQKELLEKWEEKWKLSEGRAAKEEDRFKKWFIGLAVGQGVSLLLLLVFFFLK